jgi:uncharacterized protein (DUF3820 family)
MIMTDNSRMPFGKYKGVPMEDVEAAYLLRILNEGFNGKAKKEHITAVQKYAYDNQETLKEEVKQFTSMPMPEVLEEDLIDVDNSIDFDIFEQD